MGNTNRQIQSLALFDYGSLQPDHRLVIQQHTGEIRKRLRRSAQDVWEIGQRLADVRSRLKHGQFLTWLKTEFGWSQRTAYNFINVYETFGDRFAKLAKVDIATSVLYQLAAPSVSEELRTQVLDAAEAGERITHQAVKSAIKQSKAAKKSLDASASVAELDEPTHKKPEIITVIPKSVEKIDSPMTHQSLSDVTISPGWYRLASQHRLFYGDTASSSFVQAVPQAKLAIAITPEDWAHDWLVEQADSVVILPEDETSLATVEKLLLLLSKPGDTVILPWLPLAELIAVIHRLGRIAYAGDPNRGRCQQAIAAAGLKPELLSDTRIATLVG
ncbi:DUF3102 domain-containing protein [Oscillatoria sp. CS-180]|uniref:DUF3102 domain-containing protein n=1 Tax=Oscillatoria sp. CS-180 TaxID=3021720 RepID=UPI00232ACD66|nr:DUF3102 domain-containing protein [Oscillatoria sp. CS-180]MDB9529347.1 DUF3102 domain-containing protein [Oscillatoria sp. CS-180]